MNVTNLLKLRDYLFWAVVIGFILLSAMMVLPFAGAIISAYILAYFIRPLFIRIKPLCGNTLAAMLCIIITIILVVAPITLLSLQILNEVGGTSKDQGIANITNAIATQPFLKSLNIDTVELNAWIVQTLNDVVKTTSEAIPIFGLSLVVTLNGMFYLLCNWDELASHLKRYLPFKNKKKITSELGGTAEALIHGHVFISVLEAVIAFIGFTLVGVQGSLIFSVLIFMLAFIPSVGPLLIWAPLALYYLSINQYITMAGIVMTGLTLLIGIEFYFYTRFVGSRSHIHPFIMLVGVFGGISVFGIFGFIIGPLLLVNSIKIIEEAIEYQVHIAFP